MARRRNSSTIPSAITFPIANPSRIALDRLSRLPPLSPLRVIEDRRSFHPLHDFRPARRLSAIPSTVTVKARRHGYGSLKADTFRFEVPARTVICVRRQRRKEVLFAKGRTGRGAHSPKRRNYYSGISCR